jgi:glycosyltransferase involved in cell wall biosynthesis
MGPTPSDEGGVAHAAAQLLGALADEGAAIDCYVAAAEDALPAWLVDKPGLRFYCEAPRWTWGRWYSRTPLLTFISGQLARARAQDRLVRRIVSEHETNPYAVICQFSQIELFALRRLRKRLPPIVLHPEVHAAGELRWHRLETALARRGESPAWTLAVRGMLAVRAQIQRRDVRRARLIIAPSRRFAHHLSTDYGLPLDRIRVVPNPIDLDRFTPAPATERPDRPITILFVSRMSVRKGVDMVVELSRRLADLAGGVRLVAIGDRTLWSDYRPLLSELDPAVAVYRGPVEPRQLPDVYREADAVVQPSKYEPFALTVGEALASGLPVVASDEVGAAEFVDRLACSVFPAGDLDAFERDVRDLVQSLSVGKGPEIRRIARAEAERNFDPRSIAVKLLEHLEEAAGGLRLEHSEARDRQPA